MAGHRKGKDAKFSLHPGVAKDAGLPLYVPLDDEAVRLRLCEVRDKALDQTLALARAGVIDKLPSWQNSFDRANAELDRMADRASGGTGRPVNIQINGLDLSRIEFGSNK